MKLIGVLRVTLRTHQKWVLRKEKFAKSGKWYGSMGLGVGGGRTSRFTLLGRFVRYLCTYTVSKAALCISTALCLVIVYVLTLSSLTRAMLKVSGRPIYSLFNEVSRSNDTSSEDGVLHDYCWWWRGKERSWPIWGNRLYRGFVWRDSVIRRRTWVRTVEKQTGTEHCHLGWLTWWHVWYFFPISSCPFIHTKAHRGDGVQLNPFLTLALRGGE